MIEFISLDKDKILGNKACSVNRKGIHSNLDVKVYRCKCSQDEDILICTDCKNTCHKDHITEGPTKMKANTFICSCAKSGHNPNKDKYQKNDELIEDNENLNVKDISCNMEEYYRQFGYNYLFEKISDDTIFCAYCAYYCPDLAQSSKKKSTKQIQSKVIDSNVPKNLDEDYEDEDEEEQDNIDEEKIYYEKLRTKLLKKSLDDKIKNEYKKVPISDHAKRCQCINEMAHFPVTKNFINLSKILKKSVFENLGFNINNFCYKIFDKQNSLYSNITSKFILGNNIIHKTIREKGDIEKYQKENNFTTEYIYHSKVIEAISNYFKTSNTILEDPQTNEFFKSFNIDFLETIFSLGPRENDFLIIVKKQSLRIFRKFFSNPKINSKNFFGDQVDLNITPIHRKLTSRCFSSDLYSDLGIPKPKFDNFLDIMEKNISSYFTDFYTQRFSNFLFKLYAEYLHFLNVLIKYRLDDVNFINKHISKIYYFLKGLFANQQQNKIYLIKKQILKLISKFLIKVNDEKFFCFMDFDYSKNKINPYYESFHFCFENSEVNNMIFKIFLMINQKTYSHQSRDDILAEKIQYFLDLMMIKEDGFSHNLDIISKNKKFLIDFENSKFDLELMSDKKLASSINFINEELNKTIHHYKSLLMLEISEEIYLDKLNMSITEINSKLKNYFKEINNNIKELNFIQNSLYSHGYVSKILHILTNLRKISKTFPIEKLKNVYESLFENFLLFCKDNPFLSLSFVTHKFTKAIFHDQPEYNLSLFCFYVSIFKILKDYSYKIDPLSLLYNFKTHFNKDNIFNIEKLERYEDLYYIGSIFDNLLIITNKKQRPIVFQKISEQIKDIFASKHFSDKVLKVVDKLKQNYNIDELVAEDKYVIYTFKNFLKILNHISDAHFIATISRTETHLSVNVIEELLNIKYIHPNLRRTLIGFYTKSVIQLPYKIYNSTTFNNEIFKGMMDTIPIMNKEKEEDFSVEKQKEQLERVINELIIYPVNNEKYKDYFLEHPSAFYKYFAEAIFLPCVNCMYKISYFNEKISSELKYAVYKILVLFCKGFLFFLNRIDEYNFYDSKLFYDYLSIDVGLAINNNKSSENFLFDSNESVTKLKEECENIKIQLEKDLSELDKDNFLIKDNNIFKMFIAYLKYYFLKDKIINSMNIGDTDDEEDKNDESNIILQKSNINDNNNKNQNKKFYTNYMDKISEFLIIYNNMKRGKKNLIFSRIFADEQTYKEYYARYQKEMVDFKIRGEFKRSLFLLLLDNIIDYTNENEELSYEYNETNFYTLKKLVKIFKIDPSFCQSILLEERNRDNSKRILEEMMRKNLICLFQLVFVDYNTINSNEGKSTYKNIMKILEFIRLHCEDHNRIFQTYICYFDLTHPRSSQGNIDANNEEELEEKFYFIKFILKIFLLIYRSIIFKLKKKDILQFFGSKEIHFFDALLGKIVEFLVEIYQGNFSENYGFLVDGDCEFSEFLDVFLKTFDDILNVTELEIIVMNFMTFYLSLLEDYDMSDEIKNRITKKLNLKLILATIIYCLKKCHNKYCLKNEIENITNPNYYLPEGAGRDLLYSYKTNKDNFLEDHLFQLLSKCYILLRILSDLKNSKAIDILNNLKDVHSNIYNLKNNKLDRNYNVNIQKYEVFEFLSSIIKNVEINFTRTKSSSVKDEKYLTDLDMDILENIDNAENAIYADEEDGEENSLTKPVNFLIHNDSLFLDEKDINLFKEKIPIDNYNNKLFEFVSNIPDIRNSIKFKKRLHNYNSKFIETLSSLNYKYFEIISIIIVLVINLMMQWTMTYDEILGTDPNHMSIIYISIANLVFLGIIILNYMFFTYLSIDKEINPSLFYFLSYLFHDEIFALVWNFFIGVIATSTPQCNFLFSLQLFSIISLFETMKTIILTIKLRWKQFTSTAILIVILIIFYTGISFYFIRSYYDLEDIQLNVCSNYIYCFFSIFSYGMRMGGGIGDLIGVVKYDDKLFWALFIFQWVFYFTIVLIMLNVINGIIVDTFQDLREKNNKRNDIKENECYICAINRIEFQINSLDFEAHKLNEHNFNNYTYYLIRINEIDEHDLNSVDYQSLLCCRKKQTSFFPMKKCITLMNKKK